ncbi:MAG: hypothetical protein H6654_05970 [Ardenticatenaceae bacterium]|nr:hypothetical protein [Anaerolineales bacterium]MCB8941975.1 hypothetical protein [Ardenticatenaceae bacterium]MCB8973088.1 hypothetical protein [Ardenticatenaceae bacterium]
MRKTVTIFLTSSLAFSMIWALFATLQQPTTAIALPPDHPFTSVRRAPSPLHPLALPSTSIVSMTTPLDFFQPGTQPNQITDTIDAPESCRGCHSGYSSQLPQPAEFEPWTGWAGSMMAQAGRDPLFYAALDIANADVAFGGDFCLRCHLPSGWLNGRSTPTDGSAMTPDDQEGIQCEVCHRLVDPIPSAENPARDLTVLAAITSPVSFAGNASFVLDTADFRRGPFNIVADNGFDPHKEYGVAQNTLVSPYHQDAALCGTCHDISNPVFTWNETSQSYELNTVNQPFTDTTAMFPVERTYSEWRLSEFNTPGGVALPQFGGNKSSVSTCQDCHMRDVTGVGGTFFGSTANSVTRNDLPLHDLTGANNWVPPLIPQHPVFSATFANNPARLDALNAGVDRATAMLQAAAELDIELTGTQLVVTITNNSGHKLPTGYIEGRRMWLQVEAYDADGQLIYSSGAYDPATGILTQDTNLHLYEATHGISSDLAAQLGLPAGESFHFILNNQILQDNRIPPRGYEFAAFEAAGAAPYTNDSPDPMRYADGQYWDTVTYTLPAEPKTVIVRLLHQVASREYIEFLRDESPFFGDPNSNGQILYELWVGNGRSAPTIMTQKAIGLAVYLPLVER